MPSPIIEAAERNRRELLFREAATTNRLIQAYQALYTTLDPKIQQLQRDIELLALRNELSINKVRQLNVYSSLKQQINDQITRYGGFVDTEIRLNTTATINTAFDHSQRLTQSYFQFNKTALDAFAVTWDNLPSDAVENLLGFLRDDSPLHLNLTRDLGEAATIVFEQNLIEGIALGYNSTKIANAINSSLGQPLSWAINSVRTSALYTYREATRANYLNNSEIVSGWTWFAALDGRTCLSCWAQHGKQHTLEETLNDHHQGRCTPIPNIYPKFGITPPNIPLGEDLFNALPRSVQAERMGKEKHAAYLQGKFKFDDLSEVYQNNIYGDMLKERSLKSLLGIDKPKASVSIPTTPRIVATKNPLTDKYPITEGFTPKVKTDIQKALDAIDKVHTIPNAATGVSFAPLEKAKTGLQGQYVINDNRLPKVININNQALQPFLTALHEFGHYVDYHLISQDGDSSAPQYDILSEWRKAITSSKAVKTLQAMKDNPDAFDLKIVSYAKHSPDPKYTEYLLQYDELWARSYAQYISTKTNNLNDIVDRLSIEGNYSEKQWQIDDFKPIESAIDNLFRSLGWLK